MVALRENGNPVQVGSVTLRTPGLLGEAVSHTATATGLRGVEMTSDLLEEVLAMESVRPQETVVISDTRTVQVSGVPTRSTHLGEPAIEATVPGPAEGWGQMILFSDESRVNTWHFARTDTGDLAVTRGQQPRTYLIPVRVAPVTDASETRGLFGAIGKKVIKVLAFRLLDPWIGEVGEFFAREWEKRKRPYRLRSFLPTDFSKPDGIHVEGRTWEHLGGGRALLLVHGTFSRSHTGFGTFPASFVEDLHKLYRGRVFAMDHFTVSEDPLRNVEWFFDQVPDGTKLDLDIICHSRGGLVSRVLAEKQGEFSIGSRELKVGKVVFVATPNAGTVLADAEHFGDLIDRYTNLLSFIPDNGATDILECVITVAKQLAVGAVKGMDGLQCMVPKGKFLGDLLNVPLRDGAAPPQTRYYALGADFEPADEGMKVFLKDQLFDRIFKAPNDLVVPTNSVFEENGGHMFPIEDKHIFHSDIGIQHSGFFANDEAQQLMLGWLRS